MFQLEGIAKSYGGEALFSELTWQIPEAKNIGLVGPNGAGKTTLFRILTGEESTDAGRVVRPRDARVGYLPQEVAVEYDGTILDVILDGRRDLLELKDRVQQLEQRMAEEGGDEKLAIEYSEAQDMFRREGGYELDSLGREIGSGMGFEDADFDRPVDTFSGGWKMRALLSRLLLSRPDLLLLDEPTNHLDIESIEWLERFLGGYDGTVVTISHDRYFLNRLVDAIAELHDGQVALYHGDYDHYLEQREVRRERLIIEAAQQEKEREHTQSFIDRFRYKASKASQVQSRIKQLEKMEPVVIPPAYDSEIKFEFPSPPRIGKVVIEARDIAKYYEEHTVYDGVDFQIGRGEKVAFVGPNGAGKSTLLKILADEIEPDAGTVELGHRVEVAYFAQHSVDQLDLNNTVLQEMNEAATYESAPNVRNILGAFLFSGDDAHKPISVLSGGEKSRLTLAKLLLEPAGCLLLDEPTNHLDIPSRQVLEYALNHFEGAFCVISHDRYFLNQVVNRVVHIDDGRLADYPGSYDEYKWRRDRELEQAADRQITTGEDDDPSDTTPVSRKEIRRRTAELRREKAAEVGELQADVTALEKRIEDLESDLVDLEETLANPETYEGDNDRIVALQKEHGEIQTQLMETMQAWEEKGGELEVIENKYAAREAALRSS